MQTCQEKLRQEITILKEEQQKRSDLSFQVFLVGSEFFYAESLPEDLAGLDLEGIVFFGAVDILFFVPYFSLFLYLQDFSFLADSFILLSYPANVAAIQQ